MNNSKQSWLRISHRRGVTLIEMLMLISIIAIVLGTSVIQIQLLMRLDQDGRARIEQTSAWQRLGRQLRHDLHDAASAEPFTEKLVSGLRVHFPAKTTNSVEYRIDRKEIVRVELAKGKSVLREAYSFPRMIDARFEGRTESDRRFVALILRRTVAKALDVPPKVDEILAAIGRRRDQTVSTSTGVKS